MGEDKLVTTYELVDTKKEDPFVRLILLKANYGFLEKLITDLFEDSNYEVSKYLSLMEMACDLGFKPLANDIKNHIKMYSPIEWNIYQQSQKSDMSSANGSEER